MHGNPYIFIIENPDLRQWQWHMENLTTPQTQCNSECDDCPLQVADGSGKIKGEMEGMEGDIDK